MSLNKALPRSSYANLSKVHDSLIFFKSFQMISKYWMHSTGCFVVPFKF